MFFNKNRQLRAGCHRIHYFRQSATKQQYRLVLVQVQVTMDNSPTPFEAAGLGCASASTMTGAAIAETVHEESEADESDKLVAAKLFLTEKTTITHSNSDDGISKEDGDVLTMTSSANRVMQVSGASLLLLLVMVITTKPLVRNSIRRVAITRNYC